MKRTLYKNIDLVRIPIKTGISEYYFPQNVDWASRKIDRIAVCIPAANCYDPMDGITPVVSQLSGIGDIFLNLVDGQQRELLHAVSAEQLLHRNNHPITLNSQLDLSQCSLYLTTPPASDCTLLLYVYHDNSERDFDEPARSVTVDFPLQAYQQINFQEIIQTYIHALPATVKGIMFWTASSDPAYFTLRNYKQTYILQNLHSELARANMNGGSAADTQLAPMYFDSIDIDFQYSHIRECAGQASTQRITILY